MKKYNTVIFDLDGTLLDTLEDLAASVNYAMEKLAFPLRTLTEVRSFVGNGVSRLLELAVPDGKLNPDFARALQIFKKHYEENCQNKTKLYPGVRELLQVLVSKGYKIAIVSNKYQTAVKQLNERYFAGYIAVAIGETQGIRKKPAPDTVIQALLALKSSKDEAVYIGDSEVDIATAKNVGMDCISVSWGFRDREYLASFGAKVIIDEPLAILKQL